MKKKKEVDPASLDQFGEKWNDQYRTPDDIFGDLNFEFQFGLDVAASPVNAKCDFFITRAGDALSVDWNAFCESAGVRKVVWCNPPYSQISKWFEKCYLESQKGLIVVMLVNTSTGSKYWHDFAMKGEIRFLKSRVKFDPPIGMPIAEDWINRPKYDNAIVIFRPARTRWHKG